MESFHSLNIGQSDTEQAAHPALGLEEAQQRIEELIVPITDHETIELQYCLGRTLARDLVSPINVPAHDNAAMDGFAVRSTDLPSSGAITLRVAGISLAGRAYQGEIIAGTCIRVLTGAVVPTGCDTVIAQESVLFDQHEITLTTPVVPGTNCRLRGEDLKAGMIAIHAGRILRPADLGLIASLGIARIAVVRKLRVAFFSTGNELRSIGQSLDPGAIYDSNRYTIFGMLLRLGVEPIDLGVVLDEPELLEARMRQACDMADAVITSGGVSVGDADFTRPLMEKLGEVAFWKIAMKPGRPMAFGKIHHGHRSAYLFGLPGNPVAVMVTFYALVRDALLRLAGSSNSTIPRLTARSDQTLSKPVGRTEYLRATAYVSDDGWHVRVDAQQGSGILRSMSQANCLVVLASESSGIHAGSMVEAIPFEGLV